MPVDARSAVSAQRTPTLGMDVRTQDGPGAPHGVTPKAEASYDDGRTWHSAPAGRHGGTDFIAAVQRLAKHSHMWRPWSSSCRLVVFRYM